MLSSSAARETLLTMSADRDFLQESCMPARSNGEAGCYNTRVFTILKAICLDVRAPA